MSQPPPYVPAHSFVTDSATLANFPGQALDIEFQDVKITTDAVRTNLALIQRDDGALANGGVGYDQLSPSLQTNGIASASAWVTGAAYSVGSPVINNNNLYRCIVAHTSGVFATDLAAGKWVFVVGLQGSQIPIVVYADGQSNISLTKAFAWSPNASAKIWNNAQDVVNTGSAFVALSSTTIGIAEKYASDLADKTGRPVYLIKNGYNGQALSHWLVGATVPDMYANGTANLVAALAAIARTKIDMYVRWQAEADTVPILATYMADFEIMMGRYWTNSYFPRETPCIICSIASSATSGNADGDHMNDILLAIVNADPDKRRYLYTAALSGGTYWDVSNPGHMTGQGYFSIGAIAASPPGRNTVHGIVADPSTNQVVFGNPTFPSNAIPSVTTNANATQAVLPAAIAGAVDHHVGASNANAIDLWDAFGGFTNYVGRRANGTLLVPTTLVLDDIIAGLGGQGYDGANYCNGNRAAILFRVSEPSGWTATHRGTYIALYTTPTGTDTGAEAMRIQPSGGVSIGTTMDPGIGGLALHPNASVTPVNNGDLVIQATSNTSLTFKYKGSDGTVRSGSVTLA